MKKIRLFISSSILLFMGMANAQQQVSEYEASIGNNAIKRVNWNLVVMDTISRKNVKLEKEQLKIILSDKQFRDYKTARNCCVASIPLLTLAACELTSSVVILGIGLHAGLKWSWRTDPMTKHSNLTPIIFAGYVFGAALIPLIPGVILITYGAKKINHIALEYNVLHKLSYQKPLQMNIGFTNSGIGVQLNF